jgi:hypothetical protein
MGLVEVCATTANAILLQVLNAKLEWRPLYDAAWDLCRIGVLEIVDQRSTVFLEAKQWPSGSFSS